MSAFRVTTVLFITIAAFLFTGCGKDTPSSVPQNGTTQGPSASQENDTDAAERDTEKTPVIRRNVFSKTLLAEHPSLKNNKNKFCTASPDLRRIVVNVWDEGFIVDGELDTTFKRFNGFYFSPDGSKLAYIAYDGDDWYAVVNGEISPRCDRVENVYFSPDSESWAYVARDNEEAFISVNGVESKRYGFVFEKHVTFSPDGRRFAFTAGNDFMARVVLDWEEKVPVEGAIGSLTFSPDGSRFAYVVDNWDASGFYVVVDDVPEQTYEIVGFESIVFSPSGEHYAYSAANGLCEDEADCKMFIVLDGKKLIEFDGPGRSFGSGLGIGPAVFSVDEKRIAYGVDYYGEGFVVTDGIIGKKYLRVSNPFFTTNGSSVYVARVPNSNYYSQWFSVVEGIERDIYYWGGDCWPLLDRKSGDEVGFWLSGRGGEGDQAICRPGDPPPKWYARIYVVIVSPSNDFIAYVSKMERSPGVKGMCVVVDGIEGEIYDTIIHADGGQTSVIWDSATKFHYIALDGDKIYLVEEEIVEE